MSKRKSIDLYGQKQRKYGNSKPNDKEDALSMIYMRRIYTESLYYSWCQLSVTTMVLGVALNINLHYIIGGTVTLFGVFILACTIIINILSGIWQLRSNLAVIIFENLL